MTGRTVQKHARIYIDGYDMSGFTRSVPSLATSFDEVIGTALDDEIKNGLPGHASISPGTLSAFLDNTASSGMHAIMSGGNGTRTIMIPIGDRAAPAEGDPVFAGQFEQLDYIATGDDFVNAAIQIGNWSNLAGTLDYEKPWGTLLHEKKAETGVNSSAGLDCYKEVASDLGGFLVFMVFSGDGTATISVEDSADNSSFSALAGATSGELDCSSPQHGLIALGTTATVRRYLRWQISLNTATTVTFALAFIRPE